MVKEGDKAPAFRLESDAGRPIALSDFKGKPLVVYFYPRDDTPGCTREAIEFTKLAPRFAKAGATVLGISRDSVTTHCGFRDKYKLKVALLSDPDLSAHKAYGAFGEKVLYGKKTTGVIRSTFVIDDAGKVTRVFRNVKVDGHGEAVLAALGAGGAAGKARAPGPKRASPSPKKKAAKGRPKRART